MKKDEIAARGTCPLCRRTLALCKDGTLRGHECPKSFYGYNQGDGLPIEAKPRKSITNLRGRRVLITWDGQYVPGEVVTHIRGEQWAIEADRLVPQIGPGGPRRVILHRSQFVLAPSPDEEPA